MENKVKNSYGRYVEKRLRSNHNQKICVGSTELVKIMALMDLTLHDGLLNLNHVCLYILAQMNENVLQVPAKLEDWLWRLIPRSNRFPQSIQV